MLFLRLGTTVGSFVSVISLVLAIKAPEAEFTSAQVFFLVVGLILLLLAVGLEIKSYLSNRPHSFGDEYSIRNYMFDLIKGGSRVAIFSNDMSWVNDGEMKELLRTKANRNELILILPTDTDLSAFLEKEGARVHVYPDLGYTAQSRFTITNFGRNDACLAIGRKSNGQHLVEEFSSGQHPVFSVANDLVEFLTRFSKK